MIFGIISYIKKCHSDDRREEKSRIHLLGVYEILRFALNDNSLKKKYR